MRIFRRRKRNGTWAYWASWTEGGVTIRRSTRAGTRDAADLVVARWERERADPVYAASQSATFGEEARLFLKDCMNAVAADTMRPRTADMYREKAGVLVRILGADRRLATITPETFQVDFLDPRRAQVLEDRGEDKPVRDTTLYKEWVTFRQIMKRAWKGRRFGLDPGLLKPENFGPNYKPRKTFLTWKQADALLDKLEGDRRRAVAFVLATGARRGEWLAAEGVDVQGDRVRVRGTKTDEADATIPVPTPMRRWLKIAGRPPFAPWGNARRGLARACKRAGVPRVTWNDLRRTFTSLLVQAGVPAHLLKGLTRHKTTAMIDLVYGRQTPDALGDLVEQSLQTARGPSVNQRGAIRGKRGRHGRKRNH